jgi:hypothetical protein
MVETGSELAVGARVEINGRVRGEVVATYPRSNEVRVRTDVSEEVYFADEVEEI